MAADTRASPAFHELDDGELLEAAAALYMAGPGEGVRAAATAWCDVAADRVQRLHGMVENDEVELGIQLALEEACEPFGMLGTWARRNYMSLEKTWGAMVLLVLWPERARPERFAARFDGWARQWPEAARSLANMFTLVVEDPALAYVMVDMAPWAEEPEDRRRACAHVAIRRTLVSEPSTDRDRSGLAGVTAPDYLRWSFAHELALESIGRGQAPPGVIEEALASVGDPGGDEWAAAVYLLCAHAPTEEVAIAALARALAKNGDPAALLFLPESHGCFHGPRWETPDVPGRLLPITRAVLARRLRPDHVFPVFLFLPRRGEWSPAAFESAYRRLRAVFAPAFLEIARDEERNARDRRRAAAAFMLAEAGEERVAGSRVFADLQLSRGDSMEESPGTPETLFHAAMVAWCGTASRTSARPARPRPRTPRGASGRKRARR